MKRKAARVNYILLVGEEDFYGPFPSKVEAKKYALKMVSFLIEHEDKKEGVTTNQQLEWMLDDGQVAIIQLESPI